MGMRILLIEDDLVLQDSIFELLNQYGFVVEAFANSKHALKRFKEIDFDIILCDYKMPEMDGHQVLKKIKEISPKGHIPFIMLSAYADSKIFREAMNLGANDFLNKPFKSDDLIKAINKELEKTKFWRLKVEGYADFPTENPNPIVRYYYEQKELDYSNPAYNSKLKCLATEEKNEFLSELYACANRAFESKSNLRKNILMQTDLYSVTFSPQIKKGYVNIYFNDITLVKSKEEELKNQQLFYKELLDHIPTDVAVFTPDMRYIYINPKAVKSPEIREWIIGKTDYDYIDYRKPKNTDSIYRRIEAFNTAKENGENTNWIDHYKLSDGTNQHIMRRFHPVYDEENKLNFMIGYGVEVTLMIEAEEKLKKSRQRYKNLFDSNPQMVFIINRKGIVYEINKAAVDQLGYPEEELVDQTVLKVFPALHHPAVLGTIEKCFSEPEIEHSWELVKHKKDGTIIDVFEVARTIYLQDFEEEVLLIVCTDITENKTNLKLLNESSDFNKMLLKEMPVPVAILKFDKFIEVNGTFNDLLGFTTKDLEDTSLLNLVLEPFHCSLIEKMQERYACDIRVMECEVEMVAKNGRNLNILLNGTLYEHNGEKFTLVIFNNITEIRQAQLRERAADHRSDLILNGTLDAVIQFDTKGLIVDWNHQAEKLFGYTLKEAINQDLGKLIIPEKYTALSEIGSANYILQSITKITNRLIDFNAITKSGNIIDVEIYIIEIEVAEGKLFTAFIRNITDRKEAEKQAKLFVSELTRQNEELRRFAYITSHDLRAPVINLVALLEHYDESNPQSELNAELLSLFKQSTERISNTLNDLIEITKVKERLKIEKFQTCNVVDIINDTKVENAEMMLKVNPKIKLQLNGIDTINFSLTVLRSVFNNLISNALKFNSPDRPLVIQIFVERTKKSILISVKDNGLGMDMAKTENRLFSLYQKFHNSIDGKGFGLYLLKLQLEALNATLDYSSVVDTGSEFTVTIPILN